MGRGNWGAGKRRVRAEQASSTTIGLLGKAETTSTAICSPSLSARGRASTDWRSAQRARSRASAGGPRSLKRALVVADLVGLTIAFLVVQAAVSNFQPRDVAISILLIPGLAGWVALAQMYGLYEHEEIGLARSAADDLPGILLLSTLATWLGRCS